MSVLRWILVVIFFNYGGNILYSQSTTEQLPLKKSWYISLPLRFTMLQNDVTMLSGVQLGRHWNAQWETALSVYHSFYLQSFKSPAHLSGFDTQPRLFINAVGIETKRKIWQSEKKASGGLQFYSGWGFLKYDLDAHDFESKQVNYLALEPGIYYQSDVFSNSDLEISLSYRPILGSRDIRYTSANGNGILQVYRQLPNGLNFGLVWKGRF